MDALRSLPAEHEDAFLGEAHPDEVTRALDGILHSQPFRKSVQCSTLLRYIVEHTLSHEENLLRERVIGSAVFGRPPQYEPGEDPVVRLRAAEVRKRLAQYYQTSSEPVQIVIPPGGYRATFHLRRATDLDRFQVAGTHESEQILPAVLPPGAGRSAAWVPVVPRPERLRRPLWIAAVSGLVVLAVVLALRLSAAHDGSSKFWAPWHNSAKPAIISIGSNAVYRFRWDYVDRYAHENGLESAGQEFYIPFKPGDTISGSDLLPAYNSFVATGDISAVSDIIKSLDRQSIEFQERFPDDISYAELRNNPSILVGGFNNPMTMEFTKNLPFVMRSGSEIDEMQGQHRKWTLHITVGSHDTADYAIVTRLPARNDDQAMMSVAGLGGFGTKAAANLVTDPRALSDLVRTLPRGWEKENLQIVLSIKISDFKIVSREVVAYRLW